MSQDDKVAYQSAQETIVERNNMYEIGIPWKKCRENLDNNYEMAVNRLKNTEKRLQKNPEVSEAYSKTIRDYLDKGYISRVCESEHDTSDAWYLPHFPIIRPDKATTKVRIVFDASAKYQGMSLNDAIYTGPKLQNELFDVLLRFRKKPVAVICDIAEIQVGIPETDRRFHRFLWNSHANPPEQYEFNRLVFGVNTSPFLAQFVSQYNARKYEDLFPQAAETVIYSTYMDDSMDSTEDDEEAIQLYKQLVGLWSKANMCARRWLSNSAVVLAEIPPEARASQVDLKDGVSAVTKTLGGMWSAKDDQFGFKHSVPDDMLMPTKRNFLQKIASLFDPQGFIAPYIIRAKMIMQDIWISGFEWDEEVDSSLAQNIRQWFSELEDLDMIRVPRCIHLESVNNKVETVSIHTFVDASEKAYGAVVYARHTYENNEVSVRMIAAKSRVAPLTAMSIPRLELEGAVLGLRLTVTTCRALNIDIEKATLWSDSMNVLFWITNRSRKFKPFVANRVGEIHSTSNPSQWRKVATGENPADVIS